MKYTASAIGLLTRQYRSVLKKCFLINMGLFALGMMGTNPAWAFEFDWSSLNTDSVQWQKIDEETAQQYTWQENHTASNTTYTTDESGDNLLSATGAIKIGSPDSEVQYYAYTYTVPSNYEKLPRITTSLAADISNGYYYNYSRAISNNNGNNYSVSADFLGNSVVPAGEYYGVTGGAIRNNSSGKVDLIEGTFIGNNLTSSKNTANQGGAISNTGKIGTISGNFINNYLSVTGKDYNYGGAIWNNSDGQIDTITGNFIGNHIVSTGMHNYGGAIYSEGYIGIRDEDGNMSSGIVNSIFIDNYAIGRGPAAAIKGYRDLNIISDNGITLFKGNYIQENAESEKKYCAINVSAFWGVLPKLNLQQFNNGEMFMYDIISVGEGVKVSIEGDGTGTMHLYNNIENAIVNVTSTTLDIGTAEVNMKDVTFAADSTLALTVNSLDDHGSLTAEKITVDEGAKLKPTLAQGLVKIAEEKTVQLLNVTSEAEEDQNFNNFTEVLDNNMYHFEKADKNGAYNISLVKTAEDVAEEAGGDKNQAETAGSWVDGGSFDAGTPAAAVANELANLAQNDAKGLVDAVTALAPEVAPAVQETVVETTGAVFGAVSTRLNGGIIAPINQGMNSGDALDGVSIWAQGLANHAIYDGNHHAKAFNSDTAGMAMGVEKKLNNTTKAGIGYAYSKTDIDGFKRDTEVDTHTALLYGEYKPSNWYVNSILSYGWSDYDEKKNVAGLGIKADWDVESFAMQTMTGYDMYYNGFGITPEAGLRYIHIKQDGYKDSADQKVSGGKSDILTGVVGAKVSKSVALDRGVNVRPELRAAMTYDIENDKGGAFVTLANGSSYAIKGEALNRFGVEVGTGLTTEINDNVELYLGYEGKFRKDYQDHSGILNAKYKF